MNTYFYKRVYSWETNTPFYPFETHAELPVSCLKTKEEVGNDAAEDFYSRFEELIGEPVTLDIFLSKDGEKLFRVDVEGEYELSTTATVSDEA